MLQEVEVEQHKRELIQLVAAQNVCNFLRSHYWKIVNLVTPNTARTMRTALLLLTLLFTTFLQAQATGKILVMSNVNAHVMVDSLAVGEVVAGTPFMHDAPIGDHVVHVTYGTGEKAVVQHREVAVAPEQLSPLISSSRK